MALTSVAKWSAKIRRLGNVQPNTSWMSRTAASLLEPEMYALLLARVASWPRGFPFHLKPDLQQSSNILAGYEYGMSSRWVRRGKE